MPSQSGLLHQLIGEVYYSIPKISALGFFNVGRRLIPKVSLFLHCRLNQFIHSHPQLLGTTLTYLIILNQFRRAEKE